MTFVTSLYICVVFNEAVVRAVKARKMVGIFMVVLMVLLSKLWAALKSAFFQL